MEIEEGIKDICERLQKSIAERNLVLFNGHLDNLIIWAIAYSEKHGLSYVLFLKEFVKLEKKVANLTRSNIYMNWQGMIVKLQTIKTMLEFFYSRSLEFEQYSAILDSLNINEINMLKYMEERKVLIEEDELFDFYMPTQDIYKSIEMSRASIKKLLKEELIKKIVLKSERKYKISSAGRGILKEYKERIERVKRQKVVV